MTDPPAFKLQRMETDGELSSLHLNVSNTTGAPMHLVVRPRGVSIDGAGVVHLRFWDQPLPEGVRAAFFATPVTRVLEVGEQRDVEIKFPRELRQATGKLTPEGKPEIRVIDASNAATLVLELAWSDTPFYEDTRKKERPAPRELFEQSAVWSHGRHTLRVDSRLTQEERGS